MASVVTAANFFANWTPTTWTVTVLLGAILAVAVITLVKVWPVLKGKINEEIRVTFDVAGAYGYKCLPHFGMGMVGLIVVGDDPANLAAIEDAKGPPKAQAKFDELAAMVGQ